MVVTYGLLFVAFLALYVPAIPFARARIAPWQLLFAAALLAGVFQGLMQWPGVLAVAALWAGAELSLRSEAIQLRLTWRVLTFALATVMALHVLPGFPDPTVAKDVQLTPASATMTLRANFDKGAAGLLLLAYFSPRPHAEDWPRLLGFGLGIGAATATIVIGLVAALGAVRWDPKWTELALAWTPINLFLTCVFEEMLFRGLIQRALRERLEQRPGLRAIPLAASSLLFGLAHAGGGPPLVIAATLAGVGYGFAFIKGGRVEAAVLAHFVLNASHFFLFTYPYAAR